MRRGFTLVELMVVIAVIALLIAVLVGSFRGAFGKRDEARTTATIETLKSNIASFETRWGEAPPATLLELARLTRTLNLIATNDTNQGIESLVLALRSRREGGPYLDTPLFGDIERMQNLDLDRVLPDVGAAHFLDLPDDANLDLFEVVDAWGNPLIYVTTAAIRAGTAADRITLARGEVIEITALDCQEKLRHPVTGDYPQSYALWSVGKDGINDYGRGDDITSWPKYD